MIFGNVICESKEPKGNYHEFQDYLKKNFLYGIIVDEKLHEDLNSDIMDRYKTLTPSKFSRNRSGICWDYVAYELEWFNKYNRNLNPMAYYIEAKDKTNNLRTHTWLSFQDKLQESDNKPYKAFEVSWEWNEGIWEYKSERDMLNGYLEKFIKFYKMDRKSVNFAIYKMSSLDNMYNLSPEEYMDRWRENGTLVLSKLK